MLFRSQISWGLNLKGSEYQKIISRSIKELKKDSLIIESEKYKYLLAKVLTSGVIDINNSGNGYVKSDDYDNDINTPKKPATSVPKTGGSAPAPAN